MAPAFDMEGSPMNSTPITITVRTTVDDYQEGVDAMRDMARRHHNVDTNVLSSECTGSPLDHHTIEIHGEVIAIDQFLRSYGYEDGLLDDRVDMVDADVDKSQWYPTKRDWQCEWEDMHDDMYPEFAPDPIMTRCDRDANNVVAGFDHAWGTPMPFSHKYCDEHAEMFVNEPDYGGAPCSQITRVNLQHGVMVNIHVATTTTNEGD